MSNKIKNEIVDVAVNLSEVLIDSMTPLQKHSHPKCGIPGIFPES